MFLRGYNLTHLAEQSGISLSYMSSILKDKRKPSPKVAKKIADVLEVEVSDIFIFENEEVNDHATTTK